MNSKKGFILSTYVYILLTFFLLILGTTLIVLNNTKMLAKKIKEESFEKSGLNAEFSFILKGNKTIELYEGDTFTDLGYIAQTTKGEELEATINSNVDTSKAGDYVVIYTVTYNGSTKSLTRNVKVEEFSFLETVDYTGNVKILRVPKTGTYRIELWGAQGGNGLVNGSQVKIGGKGSYTSGKILLNQNQILNIYVGEKGGNASGSTGGTAGFNGGGIGGNDNDDDSGGGGGGATDVRLTGLELKDRIIVAAGGTGSDYYHDGNPAGGLIGSDGTYIVSGTSGNGGTQINYIFGHGAEGFNCSSDSGGIAGGGGGYYGGLPGKCASPYGLPGSSSSYISGYTGCVAVTSDGTPKTGCTNGTTDNACSIHFSNKVFTESIMKAGNEEMPTHDGTSTMIGNEGNGYARITYIGS